MPGIWLNHALQCFKLRICVMAQLARESARMHQLHETQAVRTAISHSDLCNLLLRGSATEHANIDQTGTEF